MDSQPLTPKESITTALKSPYLQPFYPTGEQILIQASKDLGLSEDTANLSQAFSGFFNSLAEKFCVSENYHSETLARALSWATFNLYAEAQKKYPDLTMSVLLDYLIKSIDDPNMTVDDIKKSISEEKGRERLHDREIRTKALNILLQDNNSIISYMVDIGRLTGYLKTGNFQEAAKIAGTYAIETKDNDILHEYTKAMLIACTNEEFLEELAKSAPAELINNIRAARAEYRTKNP